MFFNVHLFDCNATVDHLFKICLTWAGQKYLFSNLSKAVLHPKLIIQEYRQLWDYMFRFPFQVDFPSCLFAWLWVLHLAKNVEKCKSTLDFIFILPLIWLSFLGICSSWHQVRSEITSRKWEYVIKSEYPNDYFIHFCLQFSSLIIHFSSCL